MPKTSCFRLLQAGTARKKRKWSCAALAFCTSLVLGGIFSPASHAADGSILRTITAQNYNCSVGTGVGFDGTNLLLSCDSDNVITAVSPQDGSFVRSFNISGISAIGAMAWDRGRNELWACGGFSADDTVVYRINLDTQTATRAFGGTAGCPDGLAFDGTDDTLYLSADVATTVQHYSSGGTLLGTINVGGKLGGCGNSGIAIGGPYLFLANDGCSQIYRAAKTDPSSPTLFGSYPARIEDMECDDLTFRAGGKAAIWTKDAYDNVLNAFELNSGDCGFGGQPPGSANGDSDGDGLPDAWETTGVDYNHDGVPDLDLKALGASPNHKDLYIQMDWMVKPPSCIWLICWGGRSFKPSDAAISDVRAAFAAAPVTNPDGSTGITAHIDAGPDSVMNPATGEKWGSRSQAHQVPFKEVLGSTDSNGYNWTDFDAIKAGNLSPERANTFHFVLFADMYQGTTSNNCPSGRCSSGISRGVPASDTIVTDGDPSWGAGFSRIQERGTAMHELGHNLSLRHGGGDDTNYKPDYLSVMNYLYQLKGLPPNSRLDYSRGAPYPDWEHLDFAGGAVGSFGASLPGTTPWGDELDPATAKAAAAFAAAGDGTVKYVGPSVLLKGGGAQQLMFDVTNISNATSSYTVSVNGTGVPLNMPSSTLTVPAGATQRFNIPVNVAQLASGSFPVTVTLSSTLAGNGLSADNATVTVPDLADPAQLKNAQDTLAKLRALPSNSGLDPAVRDALLQTLASALPWTAHVTMTGSPSSALDSNYSITAPSFSPSSSSPQSISLASWPTTPALGIKLTRVQPSAAGYKGTLHILRPDGRTVDGTVDLVWNPVERKLQGSWKSTDGGSLLVTLTRP